MDIKRIESIEYEAFWQEAINTCAFNDLKWLTCVCDKNKLSLYGIYQEEELVATFYLYKTVGRLLTNYSIPLLTPRNGLPYSKSIQSYQTKREILSTFESHISTLKFDAFHFAFSIHEKDFIPFKNNFKIDLHLTYVIDLNKSNADLFSQLRKDKQRNIKQAQKLSFVISFDKNEQQITKLIKMTYGRQNKSNQWIDKVASIVGNYEKAFQITVFSDEKPAAGLFFVYDHSTAYYLFGGYDESLKNYSAGPYAMWNGILQAKKLGLQHFDFEGSEIPAIENYFQTFGGTQENYFSISKQSFIQKTISLKK